MSTGGPYRRLLIKSAKPGGRNKKTISPNIYQPSQPKFEGTLNQYAENLQDQNNFENNIN